MSTKKSTAVSVLDKVQDTEEKSIFTLANVKIAIHFITSIIMYSVFALLVMVGIVMLMYVVDIKKNATSGTYRPPMFNA
ncbi:MAG: hypothetical protein RSG95_02930, partial [Bacilli bacterium]